MGRRGGGRKEGDLGVEEVQRGVGRIEGCGDRGGGKERICGINPVGEVGEPGRVCSEGSWTSCGGHGGMGGWGELGDEKGGGRESRVEFRAGGIRARRGRKVRR